MTNALRKTGIGIIGDVPWGTHFCQFYRTAQDLLDILIPYFVEGLRNNESCLWITSEPLEAEAARTALQAAFPDLEDCVRRGQIEIVSHKEWYFRNGRFDRARVLDSLLKKLEAALAAGREGLRLTSDFSWLEKDEWAAFTSYGAELDNLIARHSILSDCTYAIDQCGTDEVLDVISNHCFALVRREGNWELVESTGRKRADDELRRSAQFPEQNPSPVLRLSLEGGLMYANPAARALLEAMRPAEDGGLPAAIRALADGAAQHASVLEAEILDARGRTFWFAAIRPGAEAYVNLYARDVTSRKEVETAQRESEEKYRLLFQNMAEGFALYELVDDEAGRPVDWRVLEVNDAYTRHTGISREKIVGRRASDLFPAAIPEYLPLFARVVATQTPEEFETFARAVGRHQRVFTFPAGGPRFASTIEDITSRKSAEEDLRRSEERFRSLFSSMTEGFALHEIILNDAGEPVDCRFLDVNPAFERLTGLRRGDILGRRLTEVLPGIEPSWIETYGRVALTGEPATIERHYPAPLDFWHEVYAFRPAERQFAIIFMDITERRKSEALRQALAEQERLRLGAAVEQASDAVIMLDLDGKIRYVNAAFESINRLPRAKAVGRSYVEMLDNRTLGAAILESVGRGQAWHGHLTRSVPEGRPVELEVTASPIQDPARTVIGGLVTEKDVTVENALQRQVRQAQKMEALGTLAGGITHDFNNILSTIFINTELALLDLDPASPARRSLPIVLQAANRGRELVKQIITFSRHKEWERKPVEVAPIIREGLEFLHSTLSKDISIHESIAAKSGVVLADPSQIHQVLINLCQNAALAMKKQGGQLEVRLEPVELDASLAARHPDLKPGPYVRLTVADSGCGMTSELMERIFEPFFTTRKHGGGSGLGLPVVHGIVKSYGGAVTVYSEPGRGSVFSVYLPRLAGEAPIVEREKRARPEKGREHILLVEDEEAQLKSMARLLERLGYRVTAMPSGRTALTAFKKNPDVFDLVITDQTMPRMTGAELAKALVKVRPGLPIILCTGFSEKVNGGAVGSDGIRALVMKPFTIEDLSKRIRAVLKKESQAR